MSIFTIWNTSHRRVIHSKDFFVYCYTCYNFSRTITFFCLFWGGNTQYDIRTKFGSHVITMGDNIVATLARCATGGAGVHCRFSRERSVRDIGSDGIGPSAGRTAPYSFIVCVLHNSPPPPPHTHNGYRYYAIFAQCVTISLRAFVCSALYVCVVSIPLNE